MILIVWFSFSLFSFLLSFCNWKKYQFRKFIIIAFVFVLFIWLFFFFSVILLIFIFRLFFFYYFILKLLFFFVDIFIWRKKRDEERKKEKSKILYFLQATKAHAPFRYTAIAFLVTVILTVTSFYYTRAYIEDRAREEMFERRQEAAASKWWRWWWADGADFALLQIMIS